MTEYGTAPGQALLPATLALSKVVSEAPSQFIHGTSIQYAWNSSDLGALKKCPRYYQLSVLEGWKPKTTGLHLNFGAHYATAMERFFLWREEHSLTHDEALLLVVWALLQDTFGWESFDSKKNRETLVRSVVWYFENFRDDPAQTVILNNGKPAVELRFAFEVDFTIQDHEILLCGHLDRLVEYGGQYYITDQKTTGSTLGPYYFDQYNPSNQMTLYTIAAKVVYNVNVKGVIIDAAQIAVGFTAFNRGITLRTEHQLEEFLLDFQIWVETAAMYAERQHWPMNEASCNNFGKCQFRDICNKDPAVRQRYLETEFEVCHRNPLGEH